MKVAGSVFISGSLAALGAAAIYRSAKEKLSRRKPFDLEALPDAMQDEIISFAGPKDVARLAQAGPQLNALINQPTHTQVRKTLKATCERAGISFRHGKPPKTTLLAKMASQSFQRQLFTLPQTGPRDIRVTSQWIRQHFATANRHAHMVDRLTGARERGPVNLHALSPDGQKMATVDHSWDFRHQQVKPIIDIYEKLDDGAWQKTGVQCNYRTLPKTEGRHLFAESVHWLSDNTLSVSSQEYDVNAAPGLTEKPGAQDLSSCTRYFKCPHVP